VAPNFACFAKQNWQSYPEFCRNFGIDPADRPWGGILRKGPGLSAVACIEGSLLSLP